MTAIISNNNNNNTHKAQTNTRTQDEREKAMKVLSENITCLSQRINIAPFSHSFIQCYAAMYHHRI